MKRGWVTALICAAGCVGGSMVSGDMKPPSAPGSDAAPSHQEMSPPAADQGDGVEDMLPPEFKSGARLRALVINGADGSSMFTLRFRDTMLGTDCAFQQASDRKLHCLPGGPFAN